MVTLLPTKRATLQIPLEELHSLRELELPGATLAQRPLVEQHVVSLFMSDPATWEPILATKTDKGWLMVDGYHRQEAARRQEQSTLKATVRSFASEEEVIEAAFQANLHHGLPASASNRSAYAYWLHTTFPELPQTEIAQRVGVKPSTVNVAIKRRERERQTSEERSRQRTSILYNKEREEQKEREDAKHKQLVRDIRAYVRVSKRLSESLKGVGSEYSCKKALNEHISEQERMPLWQMATYIEEYVVSRLPPELVEKLAGTGSHSRSRSTHTKL